MWHLFNHICDKEINTVLAGAFLSATANVYPPFSNQESTQSALAQQGHPPIGQEEGIWRQKQTKRTNQKPERNKHKQKPS